MNRPPVILLGGADNVLSIARSLGRYGVAVNVAAAPTALVRASRFCQQFWAPSDEESLEDLWRHVLKQKTLYGSIVLCCSDEAMAFIATNRSTYEDQFILEENKPDLQLKLLDKRATINLAASAGIDAPAIYRGPEEIDQIDHTKLKFPVLVKPIYSHLYAKQFGEKLRLVESEAELKEHLEDVRRLDIAVMLCEFIPGPDDLLCSYYSYFDDQGSPLFHYTKRVIRRHPENFGTGCYHIACNVPEAIEAGLQLFRSIGFLGLANVEFKLDPRDGRLKLIEVNARFTAAQELLVRCGIDTARIVYDRLAGNPVTIAKDTKVNKRLWFPAQDFAAFRTLRRSGRISLARWLMSVAHRQVFPKFDLLDPMPALVGSSRTALRRLGLKP